MNIEPEAEASQPQVIHLKGEAHFGKNGSCLWYTANGSELICTVRNQSDLNPLTVAITGAPETVRTVSGAPFNGCHCLPSADAAGMTVIADFEGSVVTIANISVDRARCYVRAV